MVRSWKIFPLAQVVCCVPDGCLHLHQVPVFSSLTILPCIKDAKLKIYLIVLTIFKTMENILKAWTYVNVLVFNRMKTKAMIFSTRQMSRHHHLGNSDTCSVVLKGNGAENRVKRKNIMKILGMKIDQHLTWKECAGNVIKSSYGTLRSLKLFKSGSFLYR